ncbi:hypothetical protein [Caloramator proteoclasticus]|uniref:Uncharacterized protein n=1 Tax=Caloramator proteoclasticus DSM 10124 TaxID=1121262 RepID=A0A1M4Y2W3_9CLOT|nr:hypothetical protein [Caloramator proteoclasticus]SHF00167.1 hypothetical protein SAMN02746091_01565 [Caloramator proteoclasticus DSM 10124]
MTKKEFKNSVTPEVTEMYPTDDRAVESYCEGKPCTFKHVESNIKNIDTGAMEPSLRKKLKK